MTLAVSPEQVDILVAARAKGSLSLALRGVNDHEIVEDRAHSPLRSRAISASTSSRSTESDSSGEVQELKAAMAARETAPTPRARPAARYVAIYRGRGKAEQVRVDSGATAEAMVNQTEPPPAPRVPGQSPTPGTSLTATAAAGTGAFPILEAAALGRPEYPADPSVP